jgi:FkbM family methyltransferase
MKTSTLQFSETQTGSFVCVGCGARGEFHKPLLDVFSKATYVGFEPDITECKRLKEVAKNGYFYFPVALGKDSEKKTFYITSNPSCSSLLAPNQNFLDRFNEIDTYFKIVDTIQLETFTLDSYLPSKGIYRIDFIELDTQGTELDILHGTENFLSSTVLGLQVEVEFSAMYKDQALFSDIDSYLRQFNFMLFDFVRYRARRKTCSRDILTRGQVLWGKAFYLKDYNVLSDQKSKEILKLAMLASFYGFHDYALEILDFLLKGCAGPLSDNDALEVERTKQKYMSKLKNNLKIQLMCKLNRSLLKRPFTKVVAFCEKLGNFCSFINKKRNPVWKD